MVTRWETDYCDSDECFNFKTPIVQVPLIHKTRCRIVGMSKKGCVICYVVLTGK